MKSINHLTNWDIVEGYVTWFESIWPICMVCCCVDVLSWKNLWRHISAKAKMSSDISWQHFLLSWGSWQVFSLALALAGYALRITHWIKWTAALSCNWMTCICFLILSIIIYIAPRATGRHVGIGCIFQVLVRSAPSHHCTAPVLWHHLRR